MVHIVYKNFDSDKIWVMKFLRSVISGRGVRGGMGVCAGDGARRAVPRRFVSRQSGLMKWADRTRL